MSNPRLSANDLITSLIDDIANRVAERLSDVVVDSGRPEELLDEPAMAASLGVSRQTLNRYRKQGKVPCVRLGRRVLYRPLPSSSSARSTVGNVNWGGEFMITESSYQRVVQALQTSTGHRASGSSVLTHCPAGCCIASVLTGAWHDHSDGTKHRTDRCSYRNTGYG
jgi:hypothetical protein